VNEETVVADPVSVRVLVWLGFPVGAGLGWLLPRLIELIADVRVPLLRGPGKLVDYIPEPPSRIGALAVGAVVGPVVAGNGAAQGRTVRVAQHDATLGVVVPDENKRQYRRPGRRSVP
jgi:hypothetical protein